MKGDLGIITGKKDIINDYKVLSLISDIDTKITERVFSNFLNKDVILEDLIITDTFYDDKIDNTILWNLKEYKNRTRVWLHNHDKLQMVYKRDITKKESFKFLQTIIYIFKVLEDNTSVEILNFDALQINPELLKYIEEFKLTKFTDEKSIKISYEIMNILKVLYNTYIEDDDHIYYQHLLIIIKYLFEELKEIINRNQCLN